MKAIHTEYYPLNSVRVCIEEQGVSGASGKAYSPLQEGAIEFLDLNELILKLDQMFDRVGYPQAFQEKRSFQEQQSMHYSYGGIPEPAAGAEAVPTHLGSTATWDIQVDGRRNTSWQGKARRVDDETAVPFNSELELLNILSSL